MAFPDIPTGGRILTAVQANTTAARTFPSLSSLTKNAGDLLIAIVVGYQTTAASGSAWGSWSAGWTEFIDLAVSSNMCLGAAYKFSTGSETGTFSVTQAATITGHAAFLLMAISGAHASAPPEALSSLAVGTSTFADPGNLTPSWGTDDDLWLAVAGAGETGTAGSFTGLGSSPANYSGDVLSSISADVVGGTQAGVAFRQLNAASEDITQWTTDTSNARNSAIAIAVRPVPPITVDQIMTGYARGVNPRAY